MGIVFGSKEKSQADDVIDQRRYGIIGKMQEELGGLRVLNMNIYSIVSDLKFRSKEEQLARIDSVLGKLEYLNTEIGLKIESLSQYAKDLVR